MAEKYLLEAEEIIKSDTRYTTRTGGNIFSIQIYIEKIKTIRKLSFYQEKYIDFSDSLFNEEVTNNLMKAEAAYIERENQARIESQNKILAFKRGGDLPAKNSQCVIWRNSFLVLILSVILAKNNRQKQHRNKLLDERVRERTKEFEMNRDALHRAWQERDALISKASSDIQSSIATLKGFVLPGCEGD